MNKKTILSIAVKYISGASTTMHIELNEDDAVHADFINSVQGIKDRIINSNYMITSAELVKMSTVPTHIQVSEAVA